MTDDLDRRWIEALRRHSEHPGPTDEAWQAVLQRADSGVPSSPTAVSRRGRLLLAAAVIALLAGAGVVLASRRSDHAATRVRTDTATASPKPGDGRLVVVNEFDGPSILDEHLHFIEGGVGLTRVLQGNTVVAELRGWALGNRTVLDKPLPAGTYEVRSWEIACGASGCALDAHGILTDPGELRAQPLGEPCSARGHRRSRRRDDRRDAPGTRRRHRSHGLLVRHRNVHEGRARHCGLPSGEEGVIHRFSIRGGPGNATLAERTIGDDSTVLVVDRPIPRGEYKLRVEHYDCPASCPDVGPDGRPTNGAKPLAGLGRNAPFTIGDRSTPVVITVDGATCTVSRPPSLPRLTVPPAWSLRTPLPTTCGTDMLHATTLSIGNGVDPGKGARQCFLRAHQARQPMELVSTQPVSRTASPQIIWRTMAGGLKPSAQATARRTPGRRRTVTSAPPPHRNG